MKSLITKEQQVTEITVLSDHVVKVQTETIVKDGEDIVTTNSDYYLIRPGEDTTNETERVKAVCAKIHTPEVIAIYNGTFNPTKEVTPGLIKEIKIGKIHILEDGTLVAEKVTQALDNGKEIGKSKVVEKIVPGTDVTEKAQRVKDIASVIHTQDVIAAYNAKIVEAL